VPYLLKRKTGGVCPIMIVTVGGSPGSGTTTLCRGLARFFELTHVYAGKIFRDMAAEKGVTLEEFSKLAEESDIIDLTVDKRQRELAVDGTVVEGRITAHLVDADLKIWLDAPLEVRAERIAFREGIAYEEALKHIEEREASEKKRYKKYYQIDLDDMKVYHIVLDTELWDADGVFEICRAAIEVRKW
jgi:cytidylate kinase